ncbi:uncharacterized protein LOC135392532 [Ornithodoros turicata]|uniref:uncharacterized protein LOC135392532 n=1 Tax=Ornithodoros turicata TaxID=34597 RepID=UPI003138CE49
MNEFPGLSSDTTPSGLSVPVAERPIDHHASYADVWITIVTVLAVIVGGAVLLALRKPRPTPRHSDNICDTRDCLTHAFHLNTSVNPKVNPCVDFYEYTCSFWYRDYSYHEVDRLDELLASNLLSTFNNNNNKANTTSVAVLNSFRMYNSCIHRVNDIVSFKAFMKERRIPWPEEPAEDVDPLDVHLDLTINWGQCYWMCLKIVRPWYEGQYVVVFFNPQDMHSWKNREGGRGSFHNFTTRVRHFVEALNVKVNVSKLPRLYRDEAIVRNFVTRGKAHALSGSSFRVRDLRNHTGSDRWATFLNNHFQPDFTVTDDTKVMVHNMRVLHELRSVLTSSRSPYLLDVLGWTFVQENAWMAVPDVDVVTFGNLTHAARALPMFCLRVTEESFGILPWTPWILQHFPVSERQRVNRIVDNVVHVLEGKVRNSTLINNMTKQIALGKISRMYRVIWPPDYYFDEQRLDQAYQTFSLMNDTFFQNWNRSLADLRGLIGHKDYLYIYKKTMKDHLGPIVYLHYFNVLRMAMGQLVPPLYYTHGTLASNYGYLATLYASYAAKTMDYMGRRLDAVGVQGDWWSANIPLNCTSTAVERRMLRLLGYETAFAAFKLALSVELNMTRDLRLASMEQYSGDEVFYMSSCRPYCSQMKTAMEDCNMAMQTAGFKEAFHCSVQQDWDVKMCQFV